MNDIIVISVFFLGGIFLIMYLKEKKKNLRLTALYRREKETSTIDPLTGLYNRRKLDRRLNEEIGRAARYGHSLQVMFIDLDNFKEVNDVYGHDKGDEILKRVANNLKQTVRRYDILARYGGDEFVLVMPETSGESAKNVGRKIIEIIENLEINNSIINISASIGIKSFRSKCPTADLIQGADSAMYTAKNEGKGSICIHKN